MKQKNTRNNGRKPTYTYFHHPVKVFLAKIPEFFGMLVGGALFAAFVIVLFLMDSNEAFRQNMIADIRCIGLAASACYLFVRFAICTNLFGTDKKRKRAR